MGSYLSPGVYVETVTSAIQPIAGVGTSTAAFIGVIAGTSIQVLDRPVYTSLGTGDGTQTTFALKDADVDTRGRYEFRSAGQLLAAKLTPGAAGAAVQVTLTPAPIKSVPVAASYYLIKTVTVAAPEGAPQLCTSFADFTAAFGDFSLDDGQRTLAQAVYGFFNNGGTRCYVAWVAGALDQPPAIADTLARLAAIDEIALVAAPGITDQTNQEAILDHCESLGSRFAILDGRRNGGNDASTIRGNDDKGAGGVRDSSFAALYAPWIVVYDPILGGPAPAPPSGHIAGIYARVDAQRGVHKAPANEVVRGALDVVTPLSSADQDGLNPSGINAIRVFSSGVTVWGARTLGGDANGEWRYLSVRRLVIFLARSIDEGTRWTVFEPNDASLWARITRNITAFLTLVWRSGALFGATPQEAFFVKCDAETNPQDVRDAGQVVTLIGVAVTKPAEFVIFRIGQWAGPGQ